VGISQDKRRASAGDEAGMKTLAERAAVVPSSGRAVLAVQTRGRAIVGAALAGRVAAGAVSGPGGVVGGIAPMLAARRVVA